MGKGGFLTTDCKPTDTHQFCIRNLVMRGVLRRRSRTVKPSDTAGYVQKIVNLRISLASWLDC